MSGGSWDYFYFKVEEAAERLKTSECMHRVMLGHLMDKIAKAMFNIEWVDSSDKSPGQELESIEAVFKTNYSEQCYNELKTRIDKHIESMLKLKETLGDKTGVQKPMGEG